MTFFDKIEFRLFNRLYGFELVSGGFLANMLSRRLMRQSPPFICKQIFQDILHRYPLKY